MGRLVSLIMCVSYSSYYILILYLHSWLMNDGVKLGI